MRDDIVDPVWIEVDPVPGDNLHLIPHLQLLTQWNDLAVHFSGHRPLSDLTVDLEREVNTGGALGKRLQLSIGGEDVDLVLIEVQLKILDKFGGCIRTRIVQNIPDPVDKLV